MQSDAATPFAGFLAFLANAVSSPQAKKLPATQEAITHLLAFWKFFLFYHTVTHMEHMVNKTDFSSEISGLPIVIQPVGEVAVRVIRD